MKRIVAALPIAAATAGLIAPTVFLHFCLTFPEPRPWIARPAL